jgi:hypothetical protein
MLLVLYMCDVNQRIFVFYRVRDMLLSRYVLELVFVLGDASTFGV